MKTTLNIIGPYKGMPNVSALMQLQHTDGVDTDMLDAKNMFVVDSTQNTLVELPGTIINTTRVRDLIDAGHIVNIRNLKSKDSSDLYVNYENWTSL